MALLTVLLLVAAMAALCVAILDDVRFSIRRTTNAETQAQAQAYAAGAEALTALEIGRLSAASPDRTPLQPAWNGRSLSFPVEDGEIRATLRDGQACFNINSLVLGQGEDLIAQPTGAAQFVALGSAIGLPRQRMTAVADAAIDWMDVDGEARAGGAEDARYAGRAEGYRTAGVMMAEVTELRAVQGVDAALYARLRPWLCALPTTRLSPLNPNTLTVDQAPLLVAISQGRLGLAAAKAAIAARPPGGWTTLEAFWAQPALAAARPDEDTRNQLSLVTRYFDLDVAVEIAGSPYRRTALIRLDPDGRARTVIRRWTSEE